MEYTEFQNDLHDYDKINITETVKIYIENHNTDIFLADILSIKTRKGLPILQ